MGWNTVALTDVTCACVVQPSTLYLGKTVRILNPFIERNSPSIQQLFIDLSQPPTMDIDECFASDSRNIFSDVDPAQPESDMTLVRLHILICLRQFSCVAGASSVGTAHEPTRLLGG